MKTKKMINWLMRGFIIVAGLRTMTVLVQAGFLQEGPPSPHFAPEK